MTEDNKGVALRVEVYKGFDIRQDYIGLEHRDYWALGSKFETIDEARAHIDKHREADFNRQLSGMLGTVRKWMKPSNVTKFPDSN